MQNGCEFSLTSEVAFGQNNWQFNRNGHKKNETRWTYDALHI